MHNSSVKSSGEIVRTDSAITPSVAFIDEKKNRPSEITVVGEMTAAGDVLFWREVTVTSVLMATFLPTFKTMSHEFMVRGRCLTKDALT